jgi:hypothetical protein
MEEWDMEGMEEWDMEGMEDMEEWVRGEQGQ